MEFISPEAGIRYGISILGYLFVLVFGGAVVSVAGMVLVVETLQSSAGGEVNLTLVGVGLLLWVNGALTVLAGVFGLLYKVVVDGVATAIDEAQSR